MTTTQQDARGWHQKFKVHRTDGTDQPGGKHDGCVYFVLDLTHDVAAQFAALDYARQVEDSKPNLAADIRVKVRAAQGF